MTTFWVELHCEGHGITSQCWSNSNEHPSVLTTCIKTAPAALAKEARSRGWRKTRAGWLCPGCQKVGFEP